MHVNDRHRAEPSSISKQNDSFFGFLLTLYELIIMIRAASKRSERCISFDAIISYIYKACICHRTLRSPIYTHQNGTVTIFGV